MKTATKSLKSRIREIRAAFATQPDVAAMTTSELLLANATIGNDLDHGFSSKLSGTEIRGMLDHRREVRAELNRRHDANA